MQKCTFPQRALAFPFGSAGCRDDDEDDDPCRADRLSFGMFCFGDNPLDGDDLPLDAADSSMAS